MDARQRLNQLRRFKSKSNRNKVKNRQKLNDLRDLREIIVRNNSNNNKTLKTNQNKRISIKSRIGFKTQNNDNRRQRLQIVGKNKRQRIDRKSNKIVSLSDDQRIPTVVVNFSQINESPRNASNPPLDARGPPISPIISDLTPSSGVPQRLNSRNESKNSVLVSNLNKAVTEAEIKELFGEIGPIVRSSKVNNTVALVVYRSESDARKACLTYHNRYLDGIPLQCNTLSLSNDEYAIETEPKSQMSYSRQSSSLLAAQLKQINSLNSRPMSDQTFANRSDVRFVVEF